jgi:hypothetical protein
MDKLSIDALAGRLEMLERENCRWRNLTAVTALGLLLSLAIGGLPGSRVVVARQAEKRENAGPRRMEYKVTDTMYLNRLEKPLRDLAAEGWELVQVVPTQYTTSGQGAAGRFQVGFMVARRPAVPGN